jgi:hypothetical protein
MRSISGSTRATARECEDGTVIILNAYGFHLALHPSGTSSRHQPSCMPGSTPQTRLTCARSWNAWTLMASPLWNATMNQPTWRSSAWVGMRA